MRSSAPCLVHSICSKTLASAHISEEVWESKPAQVHLPASSCLWLTVRAWDGHDLGNRDVWVYQSAVSTCSEQYVVPGGLQPPKLGKHLSLNKDFTEFPRSQVPTLFLLVRMWPPCQGLRPEDSPVNHSACNSLFILHKSSFTAPAGQRLCQT